MTVARLIGELAACKTPSTLINPFRQQVAQFDVANAPTLRQANLLAYLAERPAPRALLVGEAMGWRGGRFSGIAFTSERQLADWGAPFSASWCRYGLISDDGASQAASSPTSCAIVTAMAENGEDGAPAPRS
ncbi:MAG: hypothetical protein NTZ81_06035, partial [Actinobacteria bacterium]|nr:hypothetical protein [Actinomycetota bacterium]